MSGRSPRWITDFEHAWEPNFSENSWEQVIWCCQHRIIPPTWAVGNQLTMIIDNEKYYLIDIIGIEHDTYADSNQKAPFTFMLHQVYEGSSAMYGTLPTDATWKDSYIRQTYLHNRVLAKMPTEVQAAVREVKKNTVSGGETADKLFLLSKAELTGDTVASQGTQYPYFSGGNGLIKNRIQSNALGKYWTRDTATENSAYFCYVSTTGEILSQSAKSSAYVSPAFCF